MRASDAAPLVESARLARRHARASYSGFCAPTPPCGACRQLLWEFGGDLEIILANLTHEQARHRLSALFPMPFDGDNLS